MKYQFVVGMHGNEYLPVLALASACIPHTIANPKALSIGKRWVDTDLNKSFGVSYKTYESKRAKDILKIIPKTKRVVDFHTSDTANIPFVIITDSKMLPLAKLTGLKHVVYMKHNIKEGHALIDYRNGISVEVGEHTNPKSFERTIEIAEKLINPPKKNVNPIFVFETYGEIKQRGRYQNFKRHTTKSGEVFYPIFIGKSSYNFIGLKTRKIKI